MKLRLSLIATVLALFATAVAAPPAQKSAVVSPAAAPKVPRSSLERGLEWVGVAAAEPDYTIWGGAPIFGDAGKVHLFCARWPEPYVRNAWQKSSEIAHYVADRPEGPFKFQDVAVAGSGRATYLGPLRAVQPRNLQDQGRLCAALYRQQRLSSAAASAQPEHRHESIEIALRPLDEPALHRCATGLCTAGAERHQLEEITVWRWDGSIRNRLHPPVILSR